METSYNGFWWRWLVAAAGGVVVFGLALVLFPDLMLQFFNWMFFSGARSNTSFSQPAWQYIAFTYGVLGAVMVGWGVMLLYLLLGPFRRGGREAWRIIALSLSVWFVVDSSLSLAHGFVENAIFNTLFFVLFLVPLAATYRKNTPLAAA